MALLFTKRAIFIMKFLKRLEIFIKSKIRSRLFKEKSSKKPKVINGLCDEISKAERILILRQDRIGDLLVSVPFLRSLSNSFPEKQIDILLSYRNIVAKSCIQNYVDNIYAYPRRLFKRVVLLLKLKNQNYDLIIDLFDNPSYTSSFIVQTLKSKISLGFDKENRNVYSHVVSLPDKMENHIVDRICSFLVPFGIDPTKVNKELEYPLTKRNPIPKRNEQRVGIILAGSSKSKFWGVENFSLLVELIHKKFSFEIVFFATESYRNQVSILGANPYVYFAPFTNDFDEFVSMIASCDYLITPDTSAVHLASAFKIPVVVLYTFVDTKFGMPWYPVNTKFRAILSKKDGYSDVTPEIVFYEFFELVEK